MLPTPSSLRMGFSFTSQFHHPPKDASAEAKVTTLAWAQSTNSLQGTPSFLSLACGACIHTTGLIPGGGPRRCLPLKLLWTGRTVQRPFTKRPHGERQAIFGYRPKKDSEHYRLSKQCLHAANYMMGPVACSPPRPASRKNGPRRSSARTTPITPKSRCGTSQVRQTLLSLGKLVTPFGRDRIFYAARAELQLTGKLSGAHWRDAVSYVPQATMPDVLNHGMLKTWQQLDYVWLHHQGHDSCMVSVPTDKLGEACQALKDNLTMPIVVNGHMLTIPVEVSWGFLWHPDDGLERRAGRYSRRREVHHMGRAGNDGTKHRERSYRPCVECASPCTTSTDMA